MEEQRNLFDLSKEVRPILKVEYKKNETLEERFNRWIGINPHVLRVFIGFALEMKGRGRKKIGRQLIIERMRWEWMGRTVSEDFKMSNSYTSRLVRLAIKTCPELDGFFDLRPLRTK